MKIVTGGERPKVVYADPPWQFATYSVKGKSRSQRQ